MLYLRLSNIHIKKAKIAFLFLTVGWLGIYWSLAEDASLVEGATVQKGPITVTVILVGPPPKKIGETLNLELSVLSKISIQPARGHLEIKGDLTFVTEHEFEMGELQSGVPKTVRGTVRIDGLGKHQVTGSVRIVDVRSNSQYFDTQTVYIHATADSVSVSTKDFPN